MPRLKFFIIISAGIFIIERILQTVTLFPIFIFPIFAVLFMLVSPDESSDLPYVAVASIFFDFFSGLHLGVFTLVILAVCFSIHLFKRYFNANSRSFLSLFIFSVIFIFEFIILSSVIGFSSKLVISEAKALLIETAILSPLLIVLIRIKMFFINDLR